MADIFALYGSVYEVTQPLGRVVMDVFGSVVVLYEKERPGYPAGVADAIIAYHGGVPASVAKIGAGTGKGTEILAGPFLARPPELHQRGLDLLSQLVDDFGGTVVLDPQTTLTLARNCAGVTA